MEPKVIDLHSPPVNIPRAMLSQELSVDQLTLHVKVGVADIITNVSSIPGVVTSVYDARTKYQIHTAKPAPRTLPASAIGGYASESQTIW